jgi:fluoride ion exporter CrcB/FEX
VSHPLSLRRQLCAVLCGGFCGTVTRYWLSQLIQAHLGKSWPYDIFLINITGALLLAFITTLADIFNWADASPLHQCWLSWGLHNF